MKAGETAKNHARYFVPGLHRGLAILEFIGAAGKPVSMVEVARALGISRSAAFRTLYTLTFMGFVEADEEQKTFRLGPRVLNLGFVYLASQSLLQVARPELETLRDETGISSHLAIRDGRDILFLECVQTRTGFLSNVNVGARRPAHGSPMGWLLLADVPDDELAVLYADVALEALTDQTPVALDSLRHAIGQAARAGFVVSYGIAEPGGRSVSAPIRDNEGRIVAAIDISGPVSAFDPSRPEADYVAATLSAAGRISARLGHRA